MTVEHEQMRGGHELVGPSDRRLPRRRWFNASYLADRNGISYDDVLELCRLGIVVSWDGHMTKSCSVAVVDDERMAAWLAARMLARPR
jgi:hypothetical protein